MKYLIIRCTTMSEGREVAAADIRTWHTNLIGKSGHGWEQVGYMDLFKLDGTVEHSVQDNEDVNANPWEVISRAAGYSDVSRHIAYASGVPRDGKTPKDARTTA